MWRWHPGERWHRRLAAGGRCRRGRSPWGVPGEGGGPEPPSWLSAGLWGQQCWGGAGGRVVPPLAGVPAPHSWLEEGGGRPPLRGGGQVVVGARVVPTVPAGPWRDAGWRGRGGGEPWRSPAAALPHNGSLCRQPRHEPGAPRPPGITHQNSSRERCGAGHLGGVPPLRTAPVGVTPPAGVPHTDPCAGGPSRPPAQGYP